MAKEGLVDAKRHMRSWPIRMMKSLPSVHKSLQSQQDYESIVSRDVVKLLGANLLTFRTDQINVVIMYIHMHSSHESLSYAFIHYPNFTVNFNLVIN